MKITLSYHHVSRLLSGLCVNGGNGICSCNISRTPYCFETVFKKIYLLTTHCPLNNRLILGHAGKNRMYFRIRFINLVKPKLPVTLQPYFTQIAYGNVYTKNFAENKRLHSVYENDPVSKS